ncbi:MAG TPA: SpoIIE family protein phosphatase [Gemmatimonadaceae bacterium]|nr:SpoIIE family protein phosphatase [Gemmatimonadaceae bacterium]
MVQTRYDSDSGFTLAIEHSSQVGEARRSATLVAVAGGLNETDAGKFSILVTEAATNIAKHAGKGEIMLRALNGPSTHGAELVAIDAGPGIGDLDRAFRDGYSTAGSPGNGLGTFGRLATDFDVFTAQDAGLVLAARIEIPRAGAGQRAFDVGVVRVPKRGETACGDDWGAVYHEGGRMTLTVADGLGHGQAASEASRRAVEIATENAGESVGGVITQMHAALRATRGAAVSVAEVDIAASTVRYAGLGNISASILWQQESRSLVSYNGTAGHEMRKIQEFTYDWRPKSLLVMHSDGVSARWDLNRYPGLALHDPSVVAGVIYRDFSRGRDDALVVVVRAGG